MQFYVWNKKSAMVEKREKLSNERERAFMNTMAGNFFSYVLVLERSLFVY